MTESTVDFSLLEGLTRGDKISFRVGEGETFRLLSIEAMIRMGYLEAPVHVRQDIMESAELGLRRREDACAYTLTVGRTFPPVVFETMMRPAIEALSVFRDDAVDFDGFRLAGAGTRWELRFKPDGFDGVASLLDIMHGTGLIDGCRVFLFFLHDVDTADLTAAMMDEQWLRGRDQLMTIEIKPAFNLLRQEALARFEERVLPYLDLLRPA